MQVIMSVTTAQFLLGSMFDKVVCDAAQRPNDSDVFQQVDKQWIQPLLRQQYPGTVCRYRWNSRVEDYFFLVWVCAKICLAVLSISISIFFF